MSPLSISSPERGSSCSSIPAPSGPPARSSATASCRAPAASTGASSAPGRRTARSRAARWASRGGETIARTIEHADKLGVPVVGFPHSGGARLQEGVGGAARLQRDLPRAGAGQGAADQRDRRPVRRRRGVLAGAGRPHGHGRARREDVPHRPGRRRARHARAGHGARARRPEGPRAQRRRAPRSPSTTCTRPRWSAPRWPTCPRKAGGGLPLYPPADPAPGRPGRGPARARARGLRRARRRRAADRRRRAARVRAALGAQPRRRLRPHLGRAGRHHRQPAQAPGRLPGRRVLAEGRLVRGPLRPLRPAARRARRHARLPARRRRRSRRASSATARRCCGPSAWPRRRASRSPCGRPTAARTSS